MFYFAYGSNMDHTEMQRHCPESKFLGRAYLENYKFVYDGYSVNRNCAVANIIRSHENKVWGGLYEITDNDLSRLDKKEGFPETYQRSVVSVASDNEKCEALVYFRDGQPLGHPNDIYRDILIKGAHDCLLPEEYIDTYIR